jgi:predicted GNAT family acetyltransferase
MTHSLREAADHPLDRAVWVALTTRLADLALAEGPARRLAPDYGLFAAAADASEESLRALAALVRAHGEAAEGPAPQSPDFEVVALGDADAGEMLALATLTKPGPFFRRTHRLGDFVGVRIDGRLAAMAGERLRLPGYTEVSAVCTHPDFRGRGYAAGLMSVVTQAILARREVPFLHVYDRNESAIRLYENLGWRRRRAVTVSFVQPA